MEVQATAGGLAICPAIVTAHGGHVGATSEPGKGSAFRVELPAAPEPGHPAAPA
jgi:signal transduction histidine kinase